MTAPSNDSATTPAAPVEMDAPQRSSRDPSALREPLERWLATRLPAGASPRVPSVSSPSSTGMSSETLLFDATWNEGGEERSGRFVARVEPAESDVPVFPVYDLELQFRVMRLVAEHSAVPVPHARWLELDPTALGARFFVMDRVDGRVPPDVMPYNMTSWLLEADREDQRRLEDASVGVLAALHAIDIRPLDVAFLEFDLPGETALRRHVENQRSYYDWMRGERRHPIIERAFAWLEEHWPKDEGEPVISWGDSRIGNMLYDGFTPVAVLDWEMAAIAPRGVDLAWMIFIHVFFEDIAQQAGLPGMPHFLHRDRMAELYEAKSGHPVRDLEFYETYAALRHAIVMARIHARRVRFGEAEWPADVDEPIMHRKVLERMLDGSYWR
jgi:aminoglycoside phosphotransferase (APT) family kinase protein